MTADWTCTGRTEDKKKKLPVISSHHETDVNWPKVKHQQRFKLTVLWTCQREIMWMPPISETNPGRVRRRDQKKKVFISSSTPSTTDFAHPLWLSYALSCSRRRQMPSRPLQLAGLSLEPVYQQGYLTASAAPEASDSPSGWEGCQQSPWKERRRKWARKRGGGGETKKKNTMKSEGITAQRQEWQRRFRATTLVTKINPIILWRKGTAWHLWWCLLWDRWHLNDWHVSGGPPRVWGDVWHNLLKAFG